MNSRKPSWLLLLLLGCGQSGALIDVDKEPGEGSPVRRLNAGMYPIDSVEGKRRDTLDFSPGRDWYDGWVVSEGTCSGCDRAYQPTTKTLVSTVSDVAVWGDSLELFLFQATGTCFRDGHPVIGSTSASRLKAATARTVRSDSLSTTGPLSGVLLPSGTSAFGVILPVSGFGQWRLWFSQPCGKSSGCSVPWR